MHRSSSSTRRGGGGGGGPLRVGGRAIPIAPVSGAAARPTAAAAKRTTTGHAPVARKTATKAKTAPAEQASDGPTNEQEMLGSADWYAEVRAAANAVRGLTSQGHDTDAQIDDEEENHPPPQPARAAMRRAGSPPKGVRVSYADDAQHDDQGDAFRLPITEAMRRESNGGGAPTSRSRGKPPMYKLRYGPTRAEMEAAEADAAAEAAAREEEEDADSYAPPQPSDEPVMSGARRASRLPPPVSRSSRTGLPLSPIAASPRVDSTSATPRVASSRVPASASSRTSSARSTPVSTPSSSFSVHGGTLVDPLGATTGGMHPPPFMSSTLLNLNGSAELSSAGGSEPSSVHSSTEMRQSASDLIRRFREGPPRSREQREADERREAEKREQAQAQARAPPPAPAAVAAPQRNIPWWMAEALASPFVSAASDRGPSPRQSVSALSTVEASPPGSVQSSMRELSHDGSHAVDNDEDAPDELSFDPRKNSILDDSRDTFDARANSILHSAREPATSRSRASLNASFDPRTNSILDDSEHISPRHSLESASSARAPHSHDVTPPSPSLPHPAHSSDEFESDLNPRLSKDRMLQTSDFLAYDKSKSNASSSSANGNKLSLAEAARLSHQQQQQHGLYDDADEEDDPVERERRARLATDPFGDSDDDLMPMADDDDEDEGVAFRSQGSRFEHTFALPVHPALGGSTEDDDPFRDPFAFHQHDEERPDRSDATRRSHAHSDSPPHSSNSPSQQPRSHSPGPPLVEEDSSPLLGARSLSASQAPEAEQRFFLPPDEHLTASKPRRQTSRTDDDDAADARHSFGRVRSPDTQQVQDLSRFVRQSGSGASSAAERERERERERDRSVERPVALRSRSNSDVDSRAHSEDESASHAPLSHSQRMPSNQQQAHLSKSLDVADAGVHASPTEELDESIEEDILDETHASSKDERQHEHKSAHDHVTDARHESPASSAEASRVHSPAGATSQAASSRRSTPRASDEFDGSGSDAGSGSASGESQSPQSVLTSMVLKPARSRSALAARSPSANGGVKGDDTSPASPPAPDPWPALPTFDTTEPLLCDTCHEACARMVWCHDCKLKLCIADPAAIVLAHSTSFDFGLTSPRAKSCHLSLHGPGKPFASHRVVAIQPEGEKGAMVPPEAGELNAASDALPAHHPPSIVPHVRSTSSAGMASSPVALATPSRTVSLALARDGYDSARVDANLRTLATVFGGGHTRTPSAMGHALPHAHGSNDSARSRASAEEGVSADSTPRGRSHSGIGSGGSGGSTHRESPTHHPHARRDRARRIGLTPSPPISPLNSGGPDSEFVKAAAALEAEIEDITARRQAKDAHESEEEDDEISVEDAIEESASPRRDDNRHSPSPPTSQQSIASEPNLHLPPIRTTTLPPISRPVARPPSRLSPVHAAADHREEEGDEEEDHDVQDDADHEEVPEEDSTSGLNDSFIDRLLAKQRAVDAAEAAARVASDVRASQKSESKPRSPSADEGPRQSARVSSPRASARSAAVASFTSSPLCSLCEASPSVVHCRACALFLCGVNGSNCDRDVHTASDKMRAHERETILRWRARKALEERERAEAAAEETMLERRPHALPPITAAIASANTSLPAGQLHRSFNYPSNAIESRAEPSASPLPPRAGSAFLSFPLPADFHVGMPPPKPIPVLANLQPIETAPPPPAPAPTVAPAEETPSVTPDNFSVPASWRNTHRSLEDVVSDDADASNGSLPSMEELEAAMKLNAQNLHALGVPTQEEPVANSPPKDADVERPPVVSFETAQPIDEPSEHKYDEPEPKETSPSILASPARVASFTPIAETPVRAAAVLDDTDQASWDTSVSSLLSEFDSPAPPLPTRSTATVAAASGSEHNSVRHAARDVRFRIDNAMDRFRAQIAPQEEEEQAEVKRSRDREVTAEKDATLQRVEAMLQQIMAAQAQAQAQQEQQQQQQQQQSASTQPPPQVEASVPQPSEPVPPASRSFPSSSSSSSSPSSSLAHLPAAARQAVKAALRAAALSQQANQQPPTARPLPAHARGQSLDLSYAPRRAAAPHVVPTASRPPIPPLPLPLPSSRPASERASNGSGAVSVHSARSSSSSSTPSHALTNASSHARTASTSSSATPSSSASRSVVSSERKKGATEHRAPPIASAPPVPASSRTETMPASASPSIAPVAVSPVVAPSSDHSHMLSIIAQQQQTIAEQAALLQEAHVRQRAQAERDAELEATRAKQEEAARFRERAVQAAHAQTQAQMQAQSHSQAHALIQAQHHALPPTGASSRRSPLLPMGFYSAPPHVPNPANSSVATGPAPLAASFPPRGTPFLSASPLIPSTVPSSATNHATPSHAPSAYTSAPRSIHGMFASQRATPPSAVAAPLPVRAQPDAFQRPTWMPQAAEQPLPVQSQSRPSQMQQGQFPTGLVAPFATSAAPTTTAFGSATASPARAPTAITDTPAAATATATAALSPAYSLLSQTLDDSAKRRQQLQQLLMQR